MSQIWLEVKEESEKKEESCFILHPPKTYCLNMATSEFFPQNVTTLVLFFQDFFCMLCTRFLALPIWKKEEHWMYDLDVKLCL
jgi:hypothetical protein